LIGTPRGPSFRTRLNHAIEVGQIGRGIASELGANKPLVEAIALAHDLGHPPFGHAGERALAEAVIAAGEEDWNANLHSLAVVDELEVASTAYRGLNLTWSTREGIARHSTPFDRPIVGGAFGTTPNSGLESQIVDAADVLAYLSHDLDDALAAGFMALDEAVAVSPLLAELADDAESSWQAQAAGWPGEDRHLVVNRLVVGGLVGACVRDIGSASRARLGETSDGPEAVRLAKARVVAPTRDFADLTNELLSLLTSRYYRSPRVRESDTAAAAMIDVLVGWFIERPTEVPVRFRTGSSALDAASWIASLNDYEAEKLYSTLDGANRYRHESARRR
jgi:dGTPase